MLTTMDIFFVPFLRLRFATNEFRLKVNVLEYKQPLPRTVPETNISYSDHEAVCTKLLIQSRDDKLDSKDTCSTKFEKSNGVSYADTLAEGIQVLDQILNRLRSDKNIYLVNFFLLLNCYCTIFCFYTHESNLK